MSDYNAQRILDAFEISLKMVKQEVGDQTVLTVGQLLNILKEIKENPCYSTVINFESKGAPLDTLIALCEEGPLFDGDVPSKSERNLLVEMGYAVRISFNGEQGYNAATYKGNNAYTQYYSASSMKEAKTNRLLKAVLRKASSKEG